MRSAAAFGPALAEARAAAGLSRAKLAQRSGITEREILGLERGDRLDPYLSTVLKLAQGLGVPVAVLLAPWGSEEKGDV